ncbi:OR6N2 protein, partial [Atractosteus spatula]|nr:OR6N2 protein [Atractosteus spatula]
MHFFLWNLAVLDVLITITVIPKLLVVLSGYEKTQLYFFISFTAIVMAYDRYVAIVKPLHYNNIISILASTLPFCSSNLILHIVSDYPTVMSLACGDNFALFIAMVVIYIPVPFFLWSYYRIVGSVVKMKTVESRKKAFSMSSSHMAVVFLCYASGTVVYVGLRVESIPPNWHIFIGAVYYFLPPLVNPIIYSLKNENIKAAVHRYLRIQAPLQHHPKNIVNTRL